VLVEGVAAATVEAALVPVACGDGWGGGVGSIGTS
jgi:hypothetical protein